MNRTTIINIVILSLALVGFTWWGVAQNKVNANEEILSLQKRNIELDKLIQEESEWWWIDEEAKTECVTSWEEHQQERSKLAEKYREEKKANEKRLGLLLSR